MQYFLIFSFFCMLIFPETVVDGASDGLLLWFNHILPTLLPFMITTNLIMNTKAIELIVKCFSPFLCRLFQVSKYGVFAVICGFLCGYPMGSKVTCDLLSKNVISLNEAKYLLSFCNNTSPVFLISFIMIQNLGCRFLVIPSIMILYLSPVICSFIFRKFYHVGFDTYVPDSFRTQSSNCSGLFDSCIMNAFEILTKVGGYIIIFSILIRLCELIPFSNSLPSIFFSSLLEISNGIKLLSGSTFSFSTRYTLCMFLASFGGLCAVAQTKSIITPYHISILPYTAEKLVTALVTSLLTLIIQL